MLALELNIADKGGVINDRSLDGQLSENKIAGRLSENKIAGRTSTLDTDENVEKSINHGEKEKSDIDSPADDYYGNDRIYPPPKEAPVSKDDRHLEKFTENKDIPTIATLDIFDSNRNIVKRSTLESSSDRTVTLPDTASVYVDGTNAAEEAPSLGDSEVKAVSAGPVLPEGQSIDSSWTSPVILAPASDDRYELCQN